MSNSVTFSEKEIEELKKKRELNRQIDSICILLYDTPIDTVFFGYEDYDLKKLKEIHTELTNKWIALKKAEKGTEGKYKLKHLWREYCEKLIIEQPLYIELYFYILMGQLLFHDFKIISLNKVEDLRIHPVLIGPTGIGKTEINNVIASIIKKIPKKKLEEVYDYFKVTFPKKITDVALVGSFDLALYKEQKRRKIREGDERWVDPRKYGDFYNFDLVIFDEAEIIFKPGRWTMEVQPLLRGVMNRYGTEPNQMSNDSLSSKGWIQYYATCSVVLTSYYLLEFETVFMHGGLMQRTALVVDEEDPDKRNRIQDEQIDNVQDEGDEGFEDRRLEFKKLEDKLVSELTNLKLKNITFTEEEWNPEIRKMVSFPKEIKEKIKAYKNEIKNILPLSIYQKEKFDSALSRLVQTFFKVCAINAVIEGRDVVSKEDVDEAFLLIRKLAISLAEFIKFHSKITEEEAFSKMEKDIIKALHDRELTKGELNNYMAAVWGVSLPTTITRLKKIEQQGIYEEVATGERNKKICKLKDIKLINLTKNLKTEE